MQIHVALDREIELNAEEALGSIVISDDTGAEIRQENIWIDDWLAALIDGVEALLKGERSFSAEIQSESPPLVFESQGEDFSLAFAASRVCGKMSEFHSGLKRVAHLTLNEFEQEMPFRADSFWAQIQKFAS